MVKQKAFFLMVRSLKEAQSLANGMVHAEISLLKIDYWLVTTSTIMLMVTSLNNSLTVVSLQVITKMAKNREHSTITSLLQTRIWLASSKKTTIKVKWSSISMITDF